MGGTFVGVPGAVSLESRFTKPAATRGGRSTERNMAATLERIEQLLAG